MLWLPKTNQCTFFIQFAATNDTCKWIFQRAKNATENGYAYEECIRCYIIYNHIEYLLANTADIEENRSEAKLSVNQKKTSTHKSAKTHTGSVSCVL